MQSHTSKKIAYMALFVALALIFSYVEALIPIDFGIPGIKLGIANVVSVISLSLFGFFETLIIVILRVVISGFLFGNLYSIIYSLAGGIFSVLLMVALKKTKKFSVYGISMGGGVTHNLGQLIVATLTINQLRLAFYGPILIISGLIMGWLIGVASDQVLKRVETYVR